jgi:hypothetical protein
MTEVKNGDFAAFLEKNQSKSIPLNPDFNASDDAIRAGDQVENILNVSAETLMDEEAADRLAAQMRETELVLSALPPMTDEELERQALEAGGADGNPDTPE